jgi:hypothetical protein
VGQTEARNLAAKFFHTHDARKNRNYASIIIFCTILLQILGVRSFLFSELLFYKRFEVSVKCLPSSEHLR